MTLIHTESQAVAYRQLTDYILNLPANAPLLIAIDGVDASGKSRVANTLASLTINKRPVIRASIDDFHQPRDFRYRQGALSAQGYFEDSFNYPMLEKSLLKPLQRKGSRAYRNKAFDHYLNQPVTPEVPGRKHRADHSSTLTGF